MMGEQVAKEIVNKRLDAISAEILILRYATDREEAAVKAERERCAQMVVGHRGDNLMADMIRSGRQVSDFA